MQYRNKIAKRINENNKGNDPEMFIPALRSASLSLTREQSTVVLKPLTFRKTPKSNRKRNKDGIEKL